MREEPANKPSAACHGAIWIILQQNTASAHPISQSAAHAFNKIAGRMLEHLASLVCASISARASAFASLGCQIRLADKRGAIKAACSPLPLAISSNVPLLGNRRFNTAKIGSRLRKAAGEWRTRSVMAGHYIEGQQCD